MAEALGYENGRISNTEGLVTLTLDWVTWHVALIDLYLHTKFHSNQSTKHFL